MSPILGIAEHTEDWNAEGAHSRCLTPARSPWQISFFLMVIVFLYFLPLIILIVLYSVIAKNLVTAASKVVMNKTVDPYNARARKQVILMLGTVVLCFFICLMPYRILILWIIVTPSEWTESMNPETWYSVLYFSRIMLYINSAINPILYNLMSSKFRIGFCKVCICYKKVAVRNQSVENRTNGSTTSSSLTRTTNSLKKLFHRGSLDKTDTVKVKTNFFDRLLNKRFIRQQSEPVCGSKVTKINRMRSEGSMVEVATVDRSDMDDVSVSRPDIELDGRGSLRRSVLINSAKAKSIECESKRLRHKIKVDCVVKSRSVDYDCPESFVIIKSILYVHSPILGVATFTYEVYEDGSEHPVCLTQADTFWSALFFILTIAVFFIVPLGVLLVLYSVIAKNLMENPVIIAQNTKNNNNTNNVLRYRKQVILMLGTVVLSFFLCLLPFKALTLWIIVFPPETIMSLGIDGYYILLYFCRVMLYLNSAINPILYNLMSSKFREGFVKLLRINKLMNCGRSLRENMQRRDTFNTTTSTAFSSSHHNSDSFWRRYSNRTSSQKNIIKDSKKKKEPEPNVQQLKVGEIINVVNTRRNSMQFISAMNELNDNKVEVEVHEHNCQDEDTAIENNKQIQILNLDVKTNSVYSITLDVTEKSEGKNRFVCVPVQDRESKNIFVYDFKSKESFV
ncbi:uncharacterized protein LOC134801339 [Cydia splendana]|uniref:uncharacterized protein LOC134801339 n=1 Tax=Cydia splendana TaxID=1100963 RepID=UPI00300C77A7